METAAERSDADDAASPGALEHKTEELLGWGGDPDQAVAEAPASEPAGTTDEEDIGNVGNVAIVEDLVAAKASERQIADEAWGCGKAQQEGRRGEGGDGGRRYVGEQGGRFESSNDDLDDGNRMALIATARKPNSRAASPHREGPRHHRGA